MLIRLLHAAANLKTNPSTNNPKIMLKNISSEAITLIWFCVVCPIEIDEEEIECVSHYSVADQHPPTPPSTGELEIKGGNARCERKT